MTAAKYEARAALQICTVLIGELLRQQVLARNDVLEALAQVGAERDMLPEVRDILHRLAGELRPRNEKRPATRSDARSERRLPRYLPLRRMRALRPHGGA